MGSKESIMKKMDLKRTLDEAIIKLVRHKRFIGLRIYSGPSYEIDVVTRGKSSSATTVTGWSLDDTVKRTGTYLRTGRLET